MIVFYKLFDEVKANMTNILCITATPAKIRTLNSFLNRADLHGLANQNYILDYF